MEEVKNGGGGGNEMTFDDDGKCGFSLFLLNTFLWVDMLFTSSDVNEKDTIYFLCL